MNKRERERIEREKLKQMLDNPKMKAIVDGLIDNPNPELAEIIKANLEPMLHEEYMKGVKTGFISALLSVSEKIKPCKTIDEAVDRLAKEVNSMRSKMGLKPIEEEMAERDENNV